MRFLGYLKTFYMYFYIKDNMAKVFSVNKFKRYLIIKKVDILSLVAQIDVSCHKTLIHFYSIEIIPT